MTLLLGPLLLSHFSQTALCVARHAVSWISLSDAWKWKCCWGSIDVSAQSWLNLSPFQTPFWKGTSEVLNSTLILILSHNHIPIPFLKHIITIPDFLLSRNRCDKTSSRIKWYRWLSRNDTMLFGWFHTFVPTLTFERRILVCNHQLIHPMIFLTHQKLNLQRSWFGRAWTCHYPSIIRFYLCWVHGSLTA